MICSSAASVVMRSDSSDFAVTNADCSKKATRPSSALAQSRSPRPTRRVWRRRLGASALLTQELGPVTDRDHPEREALVAIDTVAEALGNTRAVARSSYLPRHLHGFLERRAGRDLAK